MRFLSKELQHEAGNISVCFPKIQDIKAVMSSFASVQFKRNKNKMVHELAALTRSKEDLFMVAGERHTGSSCNPGQ